MECRFGMIIIAREIILKNKTIYCLCLSYLMLLIILKIKQLGTKTVFDFIKKKHDKHKKLKI